MGSVDASSATSPCAIEDHQSPADINSTVEGEVLP
jgi:hypothetical protein